MRENRTSKEFRASFKFVNNRMPGGYIGSHISLYNNQGTEKIRMERKIRNEIQAKMKKMVTQNKTIEEIQKALNQDEYKAYEQYFTIWIENWIIKLNPDIKSIIIKG